MLVRVQDRPIQRTYRGRLVRQCVTESVLLAICGGMLGTALAVLGTHPFIRMWPSGLPRADEVKFDWRILMFALTASILSGVLCGLAPALRAPNSAVIWDLMANYDGVPRCHIKGEIAQYGALCKQESLWPDFTCGPVKDVTVGLSCQDVCANNNFKAGATESAGFPVLSSMSSKTTTDPKLSRK